MPSDPMSAEDRVAAITQGSPATVVEPWVLAEDATRIAKEHAAVAVASVTRQRDEARAEIARLKELLLDMRWHPVDGGLMAVPAGWQQRRDVALGYMSGIYETAEGESVRREFRTVGPWSAGRYEANAGVEPEM